LWIHKLALAPLTEVPFELCRSLGTEDPVQRRRLLSYLSILRQQISVETVQPSIFPIGFHPDYGMPDAPLWIHKLALAPLTEVPLSCAEVWGPRIPCSGGAYFRIFPYFVSKCLLRRCNHQGRPAIFYIHPWEIDPGQPRVRLPLLKRFRHYYKLQDTLRRFERLLGDFQFTSVRKLVGL
jgi:hypothetical protein